MLEGIDFYNKSLNIRKDIVRENNTPDNNRELYIIYNQMGDILNAIGIIDEAEENYINANIIIDKVYKITRNVNDQRLLAISFSQLADYYKNQNDYKKASENILQANLIFEKLDQDNNQKYKRDLAVSYVQLGLLYDKNNNEETLNYFQRAHIIFEELSLFNNDIFKRDLAISYERLAYLNYNLRKYDISKDLYYKANTIFKELIKEYNKPEYIRDLAFCELLQVEHLISENALEEALKLQQESHKLIEQLIIKRGTAEDKRDLAISFGIFGLIYSYSNKNKSMENLLKAKVYFEDLVRERGINEDKKDLEVILKYIDVVENNSNIDKVLWKKKIKRRCWYLK